METELQPLVDLNNTLRTGAGPAAAESPAWPRRVLPLPLGAGVRALGSAPRCSEWGAARCKRVGGGGDKLHLLEPRRASQRRWRQWRRGVRGLFPGQGQGGREAGAGAERPGLCFTAPPAVLLGWALGAGRGSTALPGGPGKSAGRRREEDQGGMCPRGGLKN